MTIRAHFNGSVIVPDEPIDLPIDTVLAVDVRPLLPTVSTDAAAIQGRLEALRLYVEHGVRGTNIPDEMLRRENLYDDRA